MNEPRTDGKSSGLTRQLGLVGLAATGICAMMGAGINIVPFALQRNVPDIGPWVFPAYLLGAVPAVLAAFSYAMLSSAMPRAGGSYVCASRSLSPYLGFVASFSHWLGLCIAIGVVSYVTVPFLRDVAVPLGWDGVATTLEQGPVRVALSLLFLWTFTLVNVRGLRLYTRTLLPMMFVMFALGSIVIVAGFSFDHADFAAALLEKEGRELPPVPDAPLVPGAFLAAAAVLFSSFIGFDSIAQAGGEARDPRQLPLAIAVAVLTVGGFYLVFVSAVYGAVPWHFIAAEAAVRDVTAPGLLGYLLPNGWTVAIVAGAALALINDLPAMILSVSRLMFAWAEDGVFPGGVARVHPRWNTPWVAIVSSACMASIGILGSHLAGDFFLGVDILVTAMLVNFLLMCLSVLALPGRNPELAARITVFRSRPLQVTLASAGAVMLTLFLAIHTWKDLTTPGVPWYLRSTTVWVLVMGGASLLFWREVSQLRKRGVDVDAVFAKLPEN